MKKSLTILAMCMLMISLSACGAGTDKATESATTAAPAAAAEEPSAEEPAAKESSAQETDGLAIPLSALTAEPQFIDWTQDGVTMQVIALKDSTGEAQVAYNTCQVCAGSPYAYFEYQNGVLVCQNCGNRFGLSAVGRVSGGCNPKPVGTYQVEGDHLVISEATLAQGASSFKNWKVFR